MLLFDLKGVTQVPQSTIKILYRENEWWKTIGRSISKTKLHVLFIKDNEINQKIQRNTKEVIKYNLFFQKWKNVPEYF